MAFSSRFPNALTEEQHLGIHNLRLCHFPEIMFERDLHFSGIRFEASLHHYYVYLKNKVRYREYTRREQRSGQVLVNNDAYGYCKIASKLEN